MLLAAGWLIKRADGFPARVPGFAPFAQPETVNSPGSDLCTARALARDPGCRAAAAPPGQRRVLLWGDSFADHYSRALRTMRDTLPFAIAAETRGGCLPVLDYDYPPLPECRAWNDRVPALVDAAGIDVLILSGRWEQHGDGPFPELEATLRRLRARGLVVILFGQSPVFGFNNPDEFHYQRIRHGAPAAAGRAGNLVPASLNARLRATAERTGAWFFDPTAALCAGGTCAYREGGHYLVRDTSHLTPEGAEIVLRRFFQSPLYGREAPLWRSRAATTGTEASAP